jgi:hypothetical protein
MVTPSHFKILANTVFDIYLAGMVRQPFNLSDIVFLKDHARDADNVAPRHHMRIVAALCALWLHKMPGCKQVRVARVCCGLSIHPPPHACSSDQTFTTL